MDSINKFLIITGNSPLPENFQLFLEKFSPRILVAPANKDINDIIEDIIIYYPQDGAREGILENIIHQHPLKPVGVITSLPLLPSYLTYLNEKKISFLLPDDLTSEQLISELKKEDEKKFSPATKFPLFLGTAKYIGKRSRDVTTEKETLDELNIYKKRLETIVEERTRELKKSEEKFRLLFESANDAIFILKGEFIIGCNQKTRDLFGYKCAEIENLTPFDLSPAFQPNRIPSRQAAKNQIKKALEEGTNIFEWVHQTKDGKPFQAEISLNRFFLDNEAYIQAIIRDISERKKAQEIERKFQAIFNQTFSYIGLLDNKGKIIETNQTALATINKGIEQLKGMLFWNAPWWGHSNETIELVKNGVQNAMQGKFVRFQTTTYDIEGREIAVDLSFKPVLDDQQNVLFIIPEGRDISEQKALENKMKENIEFLSILLKTIPIPFFYKDGKLVYKSCNKAFENFTGFSNEQIIGKKVYDLYPAELARVYDESDKKALSEKKLIRYEKPLYNREGKSRNVIFFKNATLDTNGDATGVIGMALDITEIKAMEVKLRKSEDKFRNIFNSSTDGILISEINGNILDANESLLNVVGYSKHELVIMATRELILPTYLNMIKERIEIIARDRPVDPIEIEVKTKDNVIIPVEINSRLINYDNQKAILTIVRDIRARKEMEKKYMDAIVETEEKERERLARDLHDEIGPLLSSLKMYISSLQPTGKKEREGYILQQMISLVNEAIQTVRSISTDLSPHVLNQYGLEAALESLIQKIEKLIEIDFQSNLKEERLPSNIEIIYYRIIKELINNTLKHAGASRIKIGLQRYDNTLYLYYSDNGKGFDFQKTIDSKEKGIGLTNIMSRIKAINGKFSVSGGIGKGFILELYCSIA